MRRFFFLCAIAALPASAIAQTPSRDSVAKADSATRADSIALVRELEKMQSGDTSSAAGPLRGPQGSPNPRLLPDISAIGEVVADFSPKGSTQESGRRVDIREVELAIGSAVDPYFRADLILGVSDLEGIAIEEAYLTAVALPNQFAARIGRFHMPIGKQNTTHRAELQAIEYPHVIQRFLGAEGGKGTGLWLSRIFAPFGFYQEVQATVVDHFGEPEEDEALVTAEAPNRKLSGLGFSARLRNYIDLSESTNIEVSASAATGRRAQPVRCGLAFECPGFDGTPGVNARQSLIAADVTYRWRPLQRGLYKSFILQGELMRQINERNPSLASIGSDDVSFAGPNRSVSGAYVFGRYQLSRRTYLGARYDWVKNLSMTDEDPSGSLKSGSGYLQFFPSEFSKFVLGFERQSPGRGMASITRFLIQTTFAVGPHRPHPF